MSEHDKKIFQCDVDEIDWWDFFRKKFKRHFKRDHEPMSCPFSLLYIQEFILMAFEDLYAMKTLIL